MNYFIPSSVSVIIAYQGSDRHLLGTFNSLKMWFDNITVVGPNVVAISEEIKTHGGNWLERESSNIYELWEKGIQSKKSSWYLLLEGREYFSTVLKESICETIKLRPVQRTWFPIKRSILFLKQRLKHPLEWTHDPRSGLLFSGTDKQEIKIRPLSFFREKHLQGESIYFSEKTIAEVVANIAQRSEYGAEQLYQINPCLNSYSLFLRALTAPAEKFYKNWILRKGIREGFEGLVFCLLDSIVILLGHLRYYEKYVRSGKQIENNLENLNKVLIIKLRGLGDGVLATTTIKNIKQLLPKVSVSTLTFNFCKPIFENNPYLENIYGVSGEVEKKELQVLLGHLNQENFDLILNLHARNFSTKIAKKIKARWKINRSYFLREKYSDVLIGFDHDLDRTSIERDLDCLRAIGLNPRDKKPEIFVTNDEIKWAEDFLAQKKIDPSKKLIIIHPSSSQGYRNWGMERFAELACLLIKNHGYQILGCFSENEQPVAKSLHDLVEGVFIHAGPLRKSIALIYKADLMIDNASGPSHISSALNIPTIVLMGPQDYKNTYYDKDVHKESSFLFYLDVPCRDLLMSRCLPPNPCQNRVCQDYSVEEVYKKAQEFLIM
jgi:ADP-heptose:LPS heptosyltransferase